MSNKVKSMKNIINKLGVNENDIILTSSEKKIGMDKCLNIIEELVG